MEVGMRASEGIEVGEDITHPIPPISHALHISLLSSHCPACFLPLPHCNNAFHSASSGAGEDRSLSADHRVALRLVASDASASDRIAGGLLTNRRNLTAEDDEISDGIKDGALAMAASGGCSRSAAVAALCAVLTNAVEVRDESGLTSLGVAVYGPRFSWINHSCSPNACYRISLSSSEPDTTPLRRSRIVPYFSAGGSNDDSEPVRLNLDLPSSCADTNGSACGPRIRVRSLKRIKKGEEVTVAYTDLLQPLALRQAELWSKYRFICHCWRCTALPLTYVDRALEEISAVDFRSSSSTSAFDKDKETKRITEYIDDAIADYLSVGDAQFCCERLELILTRGSANPTCRLNPLHHLSLDVFTALASTYKTRVNETNGNQLLEMSRISAAYSLLLACTTNHLFRHETAFMPAVANFWASAGESLVTLASNVSSTMRKRYQMCPECSLRDIFGSKRSNGHADFESVSRKFLDCVTTCTHNVWRYLVRGSHPLTVYEDPFDFSGASNESRFNYSGEEESVERGDLVQLGVHCLLFAGYLASICMGERSYLTRHITSVLDACCVHN